MDRVVCGDVGFGKTEVALRAAFRVAMSGRQVAILCPTTVLAQQHFRTFSARLDGYPLRVDVLSRFVPKPKQTETLAALKAGRVDVVIGTHRLLSKDVHFADLGLLVVDEEQRFGVTHKERIKKLKKTVDVLTPIVDEAETFGRIAAVNADCYRAQCLATGRLLAERLGVPADRRVFSFQSRLGS